MSKSKQARAREFSAKARREIKERDNNECVFCKIGYCMEGANALSLQLKSVMHFVPRAKGGLGIPQNGAVGCQWHHQMMDNGNQGRRKEMLNLFKNYLTKHYKDWDENKLTYNKWEGL